MTYPQIFRTSAILTGAIALVITVMPMPVAALRQEGLSVGLDKPMDEREFNKPFIGSDGNGLNPSPQFCDEANINYKWTWCDSVPLKISAPSRITSDTSYLLKVTLSWPAATVDLSIILWSCTGPGGASYGTCTKLASAEVDEAAANPEVFITGDLPGGTYWLVPYQHTGSNLSYKVKAQVASSSFKAFVPAGKQVQRPKPQTFNNPPAGGDKPSQFVEPPPEGAKTELAEVQVPGPDGELKTMHVRVLAKGNVKGVQESNRSWLIPVLVALLILGGGVFTFLYRRRRAARGN